MMEHAFALRAHQAVALEGEKWWSEEQGLMWRRLSSFVSLLVLLSAGWFTFAQPTSCLCGADLPHPHLWFELPGHHHGHSSSATADGSASREFPTGPSVNAPPPLVPFGSTMPIILFGLFLLNLALLRQSCREIRHARPTGRTVKPPVPPPRLATWESQVARHVSGV